jgi:16S rRNA (cytidine1402-2'-O)-methyltransferase
LVIFEAPHRTHDLINDLFDVLGGERRIALCREMTKKFQEVFRGSLLELQEWATGREILGEVTLVIDGAQLAALGAKTSGEIARLVAEREEAGMDRREAVAAVAAALHLRKREVFDALVASKIEQ